MDGYRKLRKRRGTWSRDFVPRGWRVFPGYKWTQGAKKGARRVAPTWAELAAACVLAGGLVAAWFQWTPAEKVLQATTSAAANTIEGLASVIDGDTIEIHGKRIRILDIDAPEARQTCTAQNGAEWHCGQKAALALSDWIGQQTVTCATTTRDKYGRHLARCTVAGADVAKWLAANGWAVPFRDCKCEVVRNAADQAKALQVGIWAGSFMLPWQWRAQGAANEQTSSPQETSGNSATCQIKGNINSDGERIYHVPGGRWYDATKINESKGERWFCSEAEAIAAGWRPAMR